VGGTPIGGGFQGELAGLWSMHLVCLKGAGQWSGDPACLWIAGLAGFRGTIPAEIVQACAGLRVWWVEVMNICGSWLGRPWGHGPQASAGLAWET
jgi:hypothetical protein